MKPYNPKPISSEDDIKLQNYTLELDIDYWYSYYAQEKSGQIQGSTPDDLFIYANNLLNAINTQEKFQKSYPILGEYKISNSLKEIKNELEQYSKF